MSPEFEDDEVVFGRNAVLAFLEDQGGGEAEDGSVTASAGESGRLSKVFVSDGMRPDKRIDEIKRLARLAGVPVTVVEKRRLDRLVGAQDRHQGVVAQLSKVPLKSLEEFLPQLTGGQDKVPAGERPVLAILDGIEDPHNLGAIVRVAECAGLKAILLPARRSATITGTVARTSAGAIASLPMIRIGNIVNAIERLKNAGFWIAGLDVQGKDNYFAADLNGPLVVVVGGEGHGISRLVAQNCDFLLRIPMLGKTNSLNASVAAGILFFEIVRQRITKEN